MTLSEIRHIEKLHFESTRHLNLLFFYKQEIVLFKQRLDYVKTHNIKPGITARFEQFDNQLLHQQEVIDRLTREIYMYEYALTKQQKERNTLPDPKLFTNCRILTEEIERQTHSYRNMKKEFLNFLAMQ